MNIIGINYVQGMFVWTHDSAAALVKDGVLIATAEEERFNRVRHSKGYPYKAVDECLRAGNIRRQDVDIIAVAYDPTQFLKQFPINLYWQKLGANLMNVGLFSFFFKKYVREQFPKARIVYVPHHLAHAASAYRCSGFQEANILTVDASGETETFSCFTGKDGIIEKLWDIKLGGWYNPHKEHSIGAVYSAVTDMLAMGTHGEGKTMGLASYGQPRFDFSSILDIKTHRDLVIDRQNLLKLYGKYRRTDSKQPFTQEQKDIAASLQDALERSILNLAKEAYDKTGIRNFCLAGGVTLNCNTNSRILQSDMCDQLFIQPAANDGGVALGAALEAASQHDKPVNFKMDHAYWGPGYTDQEIEALLKDAKVAYEKRDDIEEAVAELLAQGKIIGWFQGRMELGPRALCDRTILADPSVPGMDKLVNAIKHREEWRPFAPVVTEEDGGRYFEKYHVSPFMLLTFFVKPEMRSLLPAITHVDGSSRIQTVSERQNPRCHRLLRAFEKRKGFPVLMNTSFNDKDEPIVCTPKDALKCFFGTGLDALALGPFLVRK